jgi:hypothetical protein
MTDHHLISSRLFAGLLTFSLFWVIRLVFVVGPYLLICPSIPATPVEVRRFRLYTRISVPEVYLF